MGQADSGCSLSGDSIVLSEGLSPRTLSPSSPHSPCCPGHLLPPCRGPSSELGGPLGLGPCLTWQSVRTEREGCVGHGPFSRVPSTGASFLASKWALGGLSTLIKMAGDGSGEDRAAANVRDGPADSAQPSRSLAALQADRLGAGGGAGGSSFLASLDDSRSVARVFTLVTGRANTSNRGHTVS